MIFDSLGVGEFGVVLALALVLIEPKKLGKVMKEFGKFKRKVTQIQSDVKSQLDAITREADAADLSAKTHQDKAGMRKWGLDQGQSIPASVKSQGAQEILEKVIAWPTYQHAAVISCFAGTLKEVDTDPLLRRILADGKTLLMPFVDPENKTMRMALVRNLDQDLMEGAYGIREPKMELRVDSPLPPPDLIFVPGTCFDERGGRIGHGLGFYDRYLTTVKGFRVGIAFDAQITDKNLALDPHDQFMDVLISEKRLLIFSAPSALASQRWNAEMT